MERMLVAPEQDVDPGDPASPAFWGAEQRCPGLGGHAPCASATRQLLLTALGGLRCGLVTRDSHRRPRGAAGGYITSDRCPALAPRSALRSTRRQWYFADVSGRRRNLPPSSAVPTSTGSKSPSPMTYGHSRHGYGQNAAPPSPARIQQISGAVRRALCAATSAFRSQPFTISMLWPGDRAWRQAGERRMLCGLQSPGRTTSSSPSGKSPTSASPKVWPAGTCLGIDATTNSRSTCRWTARHRTRWRVSGTVSLARFPDALPSRPEQDRFGTRARMTDAYLRLKFACHHLALITR